MNRRSRFLHDAAARALVALAFAPSLCSAEGDEGGDPGDGGAGGGGGDTSLRQDLQQAAGGGAPGGQGGAPDPHAFEYPQHWPDNDRQLFNRISDGELRKAMFDRFGAMEKGFQPKLQQHASYEKRYGSIEKRFGPMIAELEKGGSSAEKYFEGIIALEQQLLSKDPKQQVGAIKRLAELYKVDLKGLTPAQAAAAVAEAGADKGGQGGGSPPPPPAIDPELVKRLDKIEGKFTEREKTEQAERVGVLEKRIEGFASEKDADGNLKRPHFAAVADDIIALVMAEQAAGRRVDESALDKLYERAVWGRDDLRDGLIKARDAKAKRDAAEAAARKAKDAVRAGVSIPSSGSGGGDEDDSIRGILKGEFAKQRTA